MIVSCTFSFKRNISVSHYTNKTTMKYMKPIIQILFGSQVNDKCLFFSGRGVVLAGSLRTQFMAQDIPTAELLTKNSLLPEKT